MARGGARPGAGRKKGEQPSKTQERKAFAARVKSEGITPLEIMTTTMRDLWDEANQGSTPDVAKRMQAVLLAEKVAPYVHPKLTAVSASGPDGGPIPVSSVPALGEVVKSLTKDERQALIPVLAKVAASGEH